MIPIPLALTAAKDLIPWRLLTVLATVLAVFFFGHHKGAASVQAKWDADKLVQAAKQAEVMAEALKVQQSLQNQIDQDRKERSEKAARIDRALSNVIDSLRNRPEARAAAGVPAPAEPGTGCTGAGLARPDAGFLAGYAADAARLQAALNQCRSGYQAAQGHTNGEVTNGAP